MRNAISDPTTPKERKDFLMRQLSKPKPHATRRTVKPNIKRKTVQSFQGKVVEKTNRVLHMQPYRFIFGSNIILEEIEKGAVFDMIILLGESPPVIDWTRQKDVVDVYRYSTAISDSIFSFITLHRLPNFDNTIGLLSSFSEQSFRLLDQQIEESLQPEPDNQVDTQPDQQGGATVVEV